MKWQWNGKQKSTLKLLQKIRENSNKILGIWDHKVDEFLFFIYRDEVGVRRINLGLDIQ